MKTKEYFNHARLFLIPLCIFVLMISCEKDEDNPDYVGKWAVTSSISFDDQIMGYQDIYTFSKSSFSELQQLKDPDTNEWIDLFGLKGSISSDGYLLNFTVNQIGLSTADRITGMPTGNMVYYTDGQVGFSTLMSDLGMEKIFKVEYNVSGNTMTLLYDYNGDEDYNDEGEMVIYLKI